MIRETNRGWLVECEYGVGLFARSESSTGELQDVSISNSSRGETLHSLAIESGFEPDGVIAGMFQVHGSEVSIVGAESTDEMPECDALVTDLTGVALSGVTADCVPIALFAEGGCSVVHAGWRGLAVGVIGAAVDQLAQVSGSDPSAFQAFVGPAAGVCCYEVGDEVVEAIGTTAVSDSGRLASADTAIRQLTELGVSSVETVDVCTICAPRSVLNSFRRDGETAGRQGVLAWLNS